MRVPSNMPFVMHCTDLVAMPVIGGVEHRWGIGSERRAGESYTYMYATC
jgi:hypothetical protein